MRTLEELKQYLQELEPIVLKDGLLVLKKHTDGNIYELPAVIATVKEFIRLYFHTLNDDYSGYYSFYKDTGGFQCKPFANRSFCDLFLIVKYYFPDVTLFDVFKAVVEMDRDEIVDYFYCPDIKKRVIVKSHYFNPDSEYLLKRDKDELLINEAELNLLL